MPIEIRECGKQQQPVDDQRDAAKYREGEGEARETTEGLAAENDKQQQGERANQAAPEHHINYRQTSEQHERADRARNYHRQAHLPDAAGNLHISPPEVFQYCAKNPDSLTWLN